MAPGFVLTERLQGWWDENSTRREAMEATITIGRPGKPAEIANVIAFLASDRASFVNGACWSVDGETTAMLPEVAALTVVDDCSES